MATKPIANGTRMSVAEFIDLPDTEERNKTELDDGELYIMPGPRSAHQLIVLRLCLYIANYINRFAEPPAAVYLDQVTILSQDPQRVLVPDVAVVLTGQPGQIVGGYFESVPGIAVEVLSSDHNRNRDLVRKRRIYAGAGVSEYWILDPQNDTALLLELHDGDYAQRSLLSASDTLTTPSLPGLAIPLAGLFHHRQLPADD